MSTGSDVDNRRKIFRYEAMVTNTVVQPPVTHNNAPTQNNDQKQVVIQHLAKVLAEEEKQRLKDLCARAEKDMKHKPDYIDYITSLMKKYPKKDSGITKHIMPLQESPNTLSVQREAIDRELLELYKRADEDEKTLLLENNPRLIAILKLVREAQANREQQTQFGMPILQLKDSTRSESVEPPKKKQRKSNSEESPIDCPKLCGTSVQQNQMNEHETKYCPNVQVSCPAASLGCTVVVLRGQMKSHTDECRYEQSRWLIEQLDSKYDALLDKYNTLEEQHNTEITELRQLFEMKRDN